MGLQISLLLYDEETFSACHLLCQVSPEEIPERVPDQSISLL